MRPLRKLLDDFTGSRNDGVVSEEQKVGDSGRGQNKSSSSAMRRKGDFISFWKPEVRGRDFINGFVYSSFHLSVLFAIDFLKSRAPVWLPALDELS